MNFINICFDKKLDIVVFLMFLWFSHAVLLPWKNVYIWYVVFTKIFSNITKCNWWHWKISCFIYVHSYIENIPLQVININMLIIRHIEWISVFWIDMPSHELFATRHSILSRPTIKSFFLHTAFYYNKNIGRQ